MKLQFPIVILLMAVVIGSCQRNCPQVASISPALQAAMDESIENSGAIGASAAVIFADGRMWAGTSGISHEGVPLTTDMLFDIASVQKNFQAALALKLVEEGVIALDDPLDKWLPPSQHIDGAITIKQLLNLTSGINDFVGNAASPFRIGYTNIDFEKMWTWDEIQAVLIGEPAFAPGTKCAYSSTNYIVLRQIIERATGSRQSTLFENRLLTPNQLKHTLADFSKPVPANMPIAHGWFDTNGDDAAEDISGNSLNWVVSLAPMLVYSTPSDMVKWVDALYHKKTVLGEETLKEMLDFVGPVQGEPLMKGYGLGVVDIDLGALYPRWEHVRVYGHLGSQFGYMTFAGYFPDYGVSLAFMINRGCDRDSERAIATVGGPVLDVLLRHLGAKESTQQDSVSDLSTQLERSPGGVHLMYKIAKLHQANKEDHKAASMYEAILKQDPEDKHGHRMEALFWKATYDGLIWKKPENLVAFISEHKGYKDIKAAYKSLAKTHQQMGEMDRAVRVYREALEAGGKDAEFYNEYGWWVYENKVKGEYEAAIEYAKTAVQLKPEAWYIWDTLAWLYSESGERQMAVEASTKALSLAPQSSRADMEKSLARITKG